MRPVNWSSPVNWNHPLNRDLVCWLLNVPQWQGGTVWHDLTGFNDGTLANMDPASDWVGPSDRPGGWGALDFDGSDDEVQIADSASLSPTSKITVSCWVNANSLAVNDAFIGKWTFQTEGSWVMQTDGSSADEVRVFIADALDDNGSNHGNTGTSGNLVSGTWHHIAFVFEGSGSTNDDRLKIYVDGTQRTPLEFVGTIPSALIDSAAPVLISQFGGSLDRNLAGRFDDVRIYNDRALTSPEMAELYQLSKQFYPGLLNRRGRRVVVAAAAGGLHASSLSLMGCGM